MTKAIEDVGVIDVQRACDLLTTLKVTSSALYVTLPVHEPLIEHSQHDLETMAGDILQRIAEGKKPSATFIKELQRIDIHTKHLTAAYVALFNAYHAMLDTPRSLADKIVDAKSKALRDMLVMMPDKMLRDFAEMQGAPAYDYVLPGERGDLIKVIIDKMIL